MKKDDPMLHAHSLVEILENIPPSNSIDWEGQTEENWSTGQQQDDKRGIPSMMYGTAMAQLLENGTEPLQLQDTSTTVFIFLT